jgi:hypothetical protein
MSSPPPSSPRPEAFNWGYQGISKKKEWKRFGLSLIPSNGPLEPGIAQIDLIPAIFVATDPVHSVLSQANAPCIIHDEVDAISAGIHPHNIAHLPIEPKTTKSRGL